MAGRAVVVPVPSRPNQAHQRTDRYEPIRLVAAAVAVRRHTRTLSRGATWRYMVGRPAASVSDVEALQ